uniref:Tyrosine--tRNA ligase n=1 Tax=Triticum urartu TaxID=4572 RepID=A0A8R7QH61_TRIUA
MLSRAFGGYKSSFSADLSVQALRRAFGTLLQFDRNLSVHEPGALRCSSHLLHQAHQLQGQPVSPDGFPQDHSSVSVEYGVAPSACIFKPYSTVCGSFDQRLATLRSVGEHASDDELRLLLKEKTAPICYVWCDPSPWMTITQGISMTINVNKLVKAGCEVKMLMADWFALMDPKIGGNICKVQTIGRYNIEMLRASGMNLDGVEFVQLSDLISCHAEEYWPVAMDIARNSNLSEIKRCFSIHASEDASDLGSTNPFMMRKFTPADTLYPCLQSAVLLLPEVGFFCLTRNKES